MAIYLQNFSLVKQTITFSNYLDVITNSLNHTYLAVHAVLALNWSAVYFSCVLAAVFVRTLFKMFERNNNLKLLSLAVFLIDTQK